MSVMQSYIIGEPALPPLPALPALPAPAPPARSPWPGSPDRAGSDVRGGAKPDAHVQSRPVLDEPMPALYLPAWGTRRSLFGWFRDYMSSLRTLRRTLPRFSALTVTFRSDLSFLDQIAPVLLMARFYGLKTTLCYRSNKADTELETYAAGMLPFFRLASRIEVSCGYVARVFARHNLTAEVIPVPVDHTLFRPRRRTSVQPKIIMTRRLDRGNGLTGALKAFQLVKMKYPRAEMSIVGEGPLRQWLENFVKSERIFGVTFTGALDHSGVARLMDESDVYLNNATIDALPTSLLEALASGLCVVSTAVGEIPTLIRDGRNGLLVAINDYAALADRLIELIETPPLVAHISRTAPRPVSREGNCP